MQRLTVGLKLSDRFTLVRHLGGGGMGEVWLADDAELADRVALKLLDPRLSESAACVDLLRRECSRARSLVHPNIVRVFDFHAAGDRYFVSMQYIDGGTLLDSRGAAFQLIVHQALMVCDALDYAHRAGLIHRDVKPSNVLVDRNGVCYLTDFGIATAVLPYHLGSDVPPGGGTLPSMSPQQLAAEPPAVADDVYSLGALLHELLSGAPLFHPDVTPERVRAEMPAPLLTDQTGQALPDALVKLVPATLSKSPASRPAGIAAVRSVLEEVRADFPQTPGTGDVIRPVGRRGPVPAAIERPPRRRAETTGTGLSPAMVYGGLVALLVIALAVIFMLPRAVDERRAAREQAAASANPAPAPAPVDSPVAAGIRREIADEALGELLIAEDRLRAVGVDVWGAADWTEARRLAVQGDDAYQSRRYDDAVNDYRRALTLMKTLEPRAAEIFSAALVDGAAAVEAGDQPLALRQFELALAIDAADSTARAGFERATRLHEVLELTRQGSEQEKAGEFAVAAGHYEQALAIDPDWGPAREGLGRSRAAAAQLDYEMRMAAGFEALSQRDFVGARREFEAVLAGRPGDRDAGAALLQVDTELRQAEVVRLRAQARIAEAGEEWGRAVGHYESILALDPAVISVQQELQRARTRQQLAGRLDEAIAHSDQFNDDRVAREAHRLLEQARSVTAPGPALRGQMSRLTESLRIAAIPVPVEFRSDNLTEVVIYKVGSLGAFQSRTVDLKPGRYVAVGSRDGYRDVRRSFNVSPDGTGSPISLSCEDPI